MDALGPRSESASPASSTQSLDLRRLSVRADSAYSSFSAASVGPEPRTPSPEDSEPYLDWDYVRVVWGGPARAPPASGPRACQRPLPPAATLCRPCPPEAQGPPGLLSRQATPLLYALAAEAEAAARTAEPPSPPASRAAYRQRLQGAQRRVLRETSFQRKEFRMSLPARLRPAAPARPSTAHPRSASLSHPLGEAERAHSRAPTRETASRGCLASQQREWCLSEPGKLDRMGQGTGPPAACPSEARPGSGLMQPKPQDLQHGAELEGRQMGWLPGIQRRGTADPDRGSLKVREAYKPVIRSHGTSSEALGHWGGPDGVLPFVQAIPQGAGLPRPLCQTKDSRFLSQEVVAMACPAKGPQDSPADCEQKTCIRSAQLPSLRDDDVFLEEVPLVGIRVHQDASGPQGLLTSVHASDQHYGTCLNQRAGQAINIPESPLHGYPETSGTDNCWQRVNGCVGDSRITRFNPSGTANGDMPTTDPPRLLSSDPPAAAENDPLKPLPANALGPPGSDTPASPDHTDLAWGTGKSSSRPTWSSQHLEELVQELAKLDPSLSDALAPRPSPEPPLDVLEGLIPLAEVWSAMGTACGEAGKGPTEPGSCLLSSAQLPLISQKEAKPEISIIHPIPDQLCDQELPEPTNSIQAKKVELADLLQKMLQDLQAEQERLRAEAQTCARHKVALESVMDRACTPQEVERFSRFMADLERVMGLLLLLGSRLVRVRCALSRACINGDPDEQASLLQRLRLLQQQQEDAKELKEHVARRERALREVLVQRLSAKELHSYRSLLAAKAAVLAQQRSLDERVRLLQDQLDAIRSDLGPCFLPSRPAWPPGT
ncbi:PREDICTED: protein Shroom1 [Elephantulus edwardii]|uniref:protein Shroom1 n=1 Tax=Elephantulus edwardii TaxID=28737 RepID=UPI0003F0DE73|nr:PREDICTED: protein Shroom1 [Elephantulus edwardii]